MRILYVYAFLFVSASMAQAAGRAETPIRPPANLYARCESSTVPLFSNPNANDVLQMSVMVDYLALNRQKNEFEFPAVLSIKEAGGVNFLPVILKQRGGVRRTSCTDKPYKITFLRKSIENEIEMSLKRENLAAGTVLYMKRYYQLLKNYQPNIQRDGDGQKNNLFEGLGKDIKVVSHCGETDGKATYRNVGWQTQNQRVLGEYYIYKLLGLFHAVTEDAKLARIQYLSPAGEKVHSNKDENGRISHSNFAILREPKKVLAKRCGLLTELPERMRNAKAVNLNTISHYQLSFLNSFVGNFDYSQDTNHNVSLLFDSAGEAFHSAYDFDLSYPVSVEYEPLSKDVFKKFHGDQNFQKFLKGAQTTMYAKAIQIHPQLNAMIDSSLMSGEQQGLFYSWFFDVYQLIEAKLKAAKPRAK